MTISIAFIDSLGLPYSAETLTRRGLGGSESSVILLSRGLSKIGFEVTVFCRCDEDGEPAGLFDNVTYIPLSKIADCHQYDIVVSSRAAIPFINPKYQKIMKDAKYKVLYCHDTFVQGSDHQIEKMLVDG